MVQRCISQQLLASLTKTCRYAWSPDDVSIMSLVIFPFFLALLLLQKFPLINILVIKTYLQKINK